MWTSGSAVHFCQKGRRNSDRVYFESVDQFWEHCHLDNIKSSNPWTPMPFHLFRYSLILSAWLVIFIVQVLYFFLFVFLFLLHFIRKMTRNLGTGYTRVAGEGSPGDLHGGPGWGKLLSSTWCLEKGLVQDRHWPSKTASSHYSTSCLRWPPGLALPAERAC